jgi:S1-C subfamily serine protease
MRLKLFLLLALLVCALSCPAYAARHNDDDGQPSKDEARRIYQAHGSAIYQVQVIDLASGKKNSIGSGFQFTADGLIGTNYHVIAEALQRPSSNRLEYVDEHDERGQLTIMIADVVHDLAILKMDKPGKDFIALGSSDQPKGLRLFSLGNPRDIGFSIIEGTYNGKNRDSFFDKIHFSGSLNPGMSGGPAVSHDGKVVGINVSTGGNQISFLVPVEPLRELQEELTKLGPNFNFLPTSHAYIEQQLLAAQKKNVDRILAEKWESMDFGLFQVPKNVTNAFKCWGDSSVQEKRPYTEYHATCATNDRIFMDANSDADGEFYTGIYLYRFDYFEAREKLNLPRFYALYQREYAMPLQAYANAGEDDATNFDCNSRFIDLHGQRWKASFCVRQYKKYPQLYDMHLYMALVGEGRKAFMASQALQGISMDSAVKMAQRFMESIKPISAQIAVVENAPILDRTIPAAPATSTGATAPDAAPDNRKSDVDKAVKP